MRILNAEKKQFMHMIATVEQHEWHTEAIYYFGLSNDLDSYSAARNDLEKIEKKTHAHENREYLIYLFGCYSMHGWLSSIGMGRSDCTRNIYCQKYDGFLAMYQRMLFKNRSELTDCFALKREMFRFIKMLRYLPLKRFLFAKRRKMNKIDEILNRLICHFL